MRRRLLVGQMHHLELRSSIATLHSLILVFIEEEGELSGELTRLPTDHCGYQAGAMYSPGSNKGPMRRGAPLRPDNVENVICW